MPVMDGRTFLERKRHTDAAATPVLVMTASDASDLAVPNFRKPVDLDTLLNAIEKMVGTESKEN